MGRLPATDASGHVGLRLNLAELDPAEGPVNKERDRERAGHGRAGDAGHLERVMRNYRVLGVQDTWPSSGRPTKFTQVPRAFTWWPH